MRIGAPPGDSVERTAEGAHDPTYLAVSRPSRLESLYLSQVDPPCDICRLEACGRTGYTGPTGRTGPRHDPPDPAAYSTHTSLALLLASCSRLVEVYPSF